MKRRAIFELLATYHNDSEITRFLKVTRRNNRWVYTDSMELPSEAYKFHIIDVGPGNNEQWGSCHSAPLIHARPQCQYYHVYKSAGHATEALDQVSGCMSSSKTLLSPTWPTWSWMANLELSHDHVISNTWAPSYHDLNSLSSLDDIAYMLCMRWYQKWDQPQVSQYHGAAGIMNMMANINVNNLI